MTDGRFQRIRLDHIHVRDDVVTRAVSETAVDKLVISMGIVGLEHAILVRPATVYKSGCPFEEWELIAGRHRVEAARRLGWEEIDANIKPLSDNQAEFAMIDENLARKDLEPAEFVYAVYRYKLLYEHDHPETKHGAVGKYRGKSQSSNNWDSETAERYTAKAAESSGKAESSIQEAARIGKTIGKRVVKLVGTSLNKITELSALASIKDEAVRNKLIDRAIAGENVSAIKAKPKSVSSKHRTVDAGGKGPSSATVTQGAANLESEEDQMAPKEDAAEAPFFQQSQPHSPDGERSSGHNLSTRTGDGTLSNGISETIAAAEASVAPVDQKAAQRDRFWKMWASLDDDVREGIFAQLVAMSKAAA